MVQYHKNFGTRQNLYLANHVSRREKLEIHAKFKTGVERLRVVKLRDANCELKLPVV